jgi:hypothetical protein
LSRNAWLLVAYLAFVALVLGGLGLVVVPRAASGISHAGALPRLTPLPDATVPAEVPAAFPTYPGAVLVSGRQAAGGGITVLWESNDDPERVYAFYHRRLSGGGWQVTQAVDLGPIKQVQFGERGSAIPTGQVVVEPLSGGGSAIALELLPALPGSR